MYMPKFFSVLGFLLLWVLVPVFFQVLAATDDVSLGIANYFTIQGNVKDGDIVTFTNKGYFPSKASYDPSVIGVVTSNPAVSLSIQGSGKNSYPVSSAGNVEVNVSNVNGNIKKGDLITTSDINGVGMRATKTGYVIGTAMSDFVGEKNEVGQINVALNLHYAYSGSKAVSSLKDILNLSLLATYESPSAVFKYVVAGIVIILSALLGFLSFGRTANTGVEALGRNPLAGKMIQLGIIINVVVTVAIIGAGMLIAIFIIRL
jgi:hypothetical protein